MQLNQAIQIALLIKNYHRKCFIKITESEKRLIGHHIHERELAYSEPFNSFDGFDFKGLTVSFCVSSIIRQRARESEQFV